MKPLVFDVELDQTGRRGKVVMDGRDISNHVYDIVIRSGAEDVTRVELTLLNVTVNKEPQS